MPESLKARGGMRESGKKAAPGATAETFRIERWMKFPVVTVKPRDLVAHARAIVEEHRVNQLPVVSNGRLVGIVTDRDLRDAPRAVEISAKLSGADIAPVEAERIPVETVMTSNVIALSPTDPLQKAADVMRRERIGAIPIVDRKRLVGIIARSDILEAFLKLCK